MANPTLTKRHVNLVTHAYFVREGENINSTTASSTAKPVVTDALPWRELGCVQSCTITPNVETEDIECPAFGAGNTLADTITLRSSITGSLVIKNLSSFAIELFNLSNEIDSGEYVPLAAPQLKGWLKLQQFANGDPNMTPSNMVDYWCFLSSTGTTFGQGAAEWPLNFRVLESTLNIGAINNF